MQMDGKTRPILSRSVTKWVIYKMEETSVAVSMNTVAGRVNTNILLIQATDRGKGETKEGRMMEAKIEGSRISISIVDMLSSLSFEDKLTVIDTLSCDDEVITHITAQLLDGCTEFGSYGGSCHGQVDPFTPLDRARRAIALRAGEVAKKEIEDLCSTLRWEKACAENYCNWGFKMYHGEKSAMPPTIQYDDSLKYEVVRRGE